MGWKVNPNGINQFSTGIDIYIEGETVSSVAMIIKGRVEVHNDGMRVTVGSGSFLGVNDLYLGKYQSTYTAKEEVIAFIFEIDRAEELETVLSKNSDYHGFMVATYNNMIYDLDQTYQNIIRQGSKVYQFILQTYENYKENSERRGYKPRISERIMKLRDLDNDIDILRDRINYYSECRKLPVEVVKQYFSYGNAVTLYQVEEQVGILNQQIEALKEIANGYISMAQCLMDDSESCLFHLIAEMSVEINANSGDNSELMDIMDSIIEEINEAEKFSEQKLGKPYKVNRKKMEEVYHLLLTGDKEKDVSTQTSLKYTKEDTEKVDRELTDSFQKLLDYAEIEGEEAEGMKSAMMDFIMMKDKFSSDDSARAIRRKLSENHYQMYMRIFLRAYKEKIVPRLVDMFLKYGYADERLLTKDQYLSLYFLEDNSQSEQSFCTVYNIKEWLTLVYEGQKAPSKNEFDLEYPEYITDLKRQGRIKEKEVQLWLTDPLKKLDYEIQNMFKYNNRTTSGQIMTFVPVLHKDQWNSNIERMYLNAQKVNDAVASLLRIDYSIFDRELLYADKEKRIIKEYIIKKIYPDIILMPNIGSNGIMWQEISSKRRDSSARFLLPSFTDVNVTGMLVRIFGRYRWEMCRTIEGTAWNDIKHKSLTSEYSDYLQFYRKNKELSEEKKEKIKLQIQKGRNSSREIFVIDYEQWMNYESMGAIKLNKPVREILATYCPFSKEIREHIKMQPLFNEAMARYYRDKQKKIREIEARYRALQKDQIELTPELEETLEYWRES
ncbi:hypothetical protein H0486_00195 [Lachnospiraceae bacterium MD1]|uniref:Cyclic nucleotide-binding domain-containing protein n=1 Tax=Variimorphobacter saccharofermentans TaxID=2755051 RepID=A0A839JVL2_9FIRM|nr:hypothetical protein [Variimorphobacter saccharofermentans]MBB2181314.1 hypothetical protein [Variimorphobacter saccharofermentans]